MNPSYTLSVLSFLSLAAVSAQPTLDLAVSAPNAGDIYAITSHNASGAGYHPGNAGASQLYGYWMVPPTGNRDIQYLAPSATPTSASFPTATLLSTDGGADTLFWNVSAQGLEQVGIRSNLEGAAAFSNGSLELKYPCSFGTTWNDAFSVNYTVSGFPVTRAGTINGVADGYGTIQLPGIEIPNVLRIKVRKVAVDQSALVNIYRSYEIHYFYAEGTRYPVMKTSRDTVIIGAGTPDVSFSAEWLYGEGDVSVDDVVSGVVSFTAYPNPTNGQVDLQLGEGVSVRQVEVIDATGKVLAFEGRQQDGSIRRSVDLSGYTAGVYQIRITDADGVQRTQRVVLQ